MAYNPHFSLHVASLPTLPTEISEQIYNYLTPTILTRLARVNKALYASVQSPLYRHASINSFEKLKLFVRTLNNVAMFDSWGEGAISKNVVTLDISVDPNATEVAGGSRPTAVLLSRLIGAIGSPTELNYEISSFRYCPSMRVTLRIFNGSCIHQPISSFENDTFRNVTNLILHVGVSPHNAGDRPTTGPSSASLSQVIPVRRFGLQNFENVGRNICRPNSKFWTGIFNGRSFPDLKEVEIRHSHGPPQAGSWANSSHVKFDKDDLTGLGKVTRLVVESVPELNDSVLMGALTNAQNLKKLELRNVAALSYEALSQLLPHALPNLSHFTLHIPPGHSNSVSARRQLENYQPLAPISRDNPAPAHLCPLFRIYAKNLEFLDLKAPYLCRDLFVDEIEKLKLNEAGVKVDIAGKAGGTFVNNSGEAQRIDRIAIEEILKTFRRQKEEKCFKEAVQVNLVEKGAKKGRDGTYGVAITGAEYEEEQKRIQRARKIREQKWERIVRARKGMCREGESWEEMGVLAGLEEDSVEWLLGNVALGVAVRAGKGQVEIEMKLEEAFPGSAPHPGTSRRRSRNHGHDFNDDA